MEPAGLPSTLERDIAAFRRFNRMYARFLGTLREKILETEFSLAEARVLYELANRPMPKASVIAQELGLDPGYLSRLLKRLEQSALVQRKTAEGDSRFADLALTRKGKSAYRRLDQLSQSQARDTLKVLGHSERLQLIRSMQTIEKVLVKTEHSKPPFVLRPHRAGDMGWVVHREGIVYTEEYGWDGTFEGLVAEIVSQFLAGFDPKHERCWIADVRGESAGHIFLVKHPEEPHTAKLRLLFVEPSARGMGLGRALVGECVGFARAAGYRKIVLSTQSILLAAHRIYQSAGFHLVSEEAHRSFGKDLIGQTWELNL
jgi:DNA-binding MarR family transcriptional regulator/GNAT superfamily N-acetyltransferase